MNALLESAGLVSGATGLAVGISWVLKDGLGCLGMIVSSNLLSSHFDNEAKRTKFRSDMLHVFGVSMCFSVFLR